MSYVANLKDKMSLVHRSFADSYGKIMVFRENPTKIPVWQKSAEVYHSSYSSTEQLQEAL
jgi:hypothetical protein